MYVLGGVARDDTGRLEALLVGSPHPAGGLRYEGRVGFGLSRRREWWPQVETATANRFVDVGPDRRREWVRPTIAISVRALARPDGGLLRHAILEQISR